MKKAVRQRGWCCFGDRLDFQAPIVVGQVVGNKVLQGFRFSIPNHVRDPTNHSAEPARQLHSLTLNYHYLLHFRVLL